MKTNKADVILALLVGFMLTLTALAIMWSYTGWMLEGVQR